MFTLKVYDFLKYFYFSNVVSLSKLIFQILYTYVTRPSVVIHYIYILVVFIMLYQ